VGSLGGGPSIALPELQRPTSLSVQVPGGSTPNGGHVPNKLPPKVVVKEGKWDYFFGRVKSNKHNQDRSLQNKADIEKLGISEANGGREQLTKIFEDGLNAPEAARYTNEYGTTVTRTVEVAGKGKIDVKYFYTGGDMSVTPEISTIIPKVFK
jgi:hypothetical protein